MTSPTNNKLHTPNFHDETTTNTNDTTTKMTTPLLLLLLTNEEFMTTTTTTTTSTSDHDGRTTGRRQTTKLPRLPKLRHPQRQKTSLVMLILLLVNYKILLSVSVAVHSFVIMYHHHQYLHHHTGDRSYGVGTVPLPSSSSSPLLLSIGGGRDGVPQQRWYKQSCCYDAQRMKWLTTTIRAARWSKRRRRSSCSIDNTDSLSDTQLCSTSSSTTTTSRIRKVMIQPQQPQQPQQPPPPVPVPMNIAVRSLWDDAIPTMKQQLQQYLHSPSSSSPPTTQALQMALVRLGIAWSQQQKEQQQQQQQQRENRAAMLERDDDNKAATVFHMTSSRRRVPGCLSTVHIQTTLCHDVTSNTTTIHSIDGIADAYMSRGLLACIATVFQNVSIHDVTSIHTNNNNNVSHFIHQLSLETIFVGSRGRNDGFTNMIRTIQLQIQECLADILLLQPQQMHRVTNNRELYRIITPPLLPPLSQPSMQQQHPSSAVSSEMPTTMNAATRMPSVHETITTAGTTIRTRVALLLSGGVDSTVALNLLVRNNHNNNNNTQYDVTAFYLKIWLEDELSDLNVCPWEEDVRYCEAVCDQLNVPFETISLQEEYNDSILSYTIQEARNGRTPNPDILCNRRIKFGCFYDVIMNRNFDCVATGHYAQVIRQQPENVGTTTSARVQLHRAPDPIKDQSYFLCALTQQQLQRVLFPIGHLSKTQVRQYAEDYQVPNRYRPDSQGLCFLGKVKFDTFLSTYITDQPGPIIDATNNVLVGYHRGLWYHTIGQRKGLGKVLFPNSTSIGPWYIVGKNTSTNTIYCTNQYDEDIFTQTRSEFAVEDIHWIAGTPPLLSSSSTAKVATSNLKTNHDESSIHEIADTNDYDTNGNATHMIFHLAMKIRHGPILVHGVLFIERYDQKYQNDNEIDGTIQSVRGFIQLQNYKDNGLAPGQYVSFYNKQSTECYGCAVISENNWGGDSFVASK